VATLLRSDGTCADVRPEVPPRFTLEEAQGMVGGYVQVQVVWHKGRERFMLMDEEGKLKHKSVNEQATAVYNSTPRWCFDPIVGDVLVVDEDEMFG
jgi:hypothetical protein